MNRDGSRAKFSSAQMADGKLLLRTFGRSHALRLFPLRERHDLPRAPRDTAAGLQPAQAECVLARADTRKIPN